VFFWEGSRYFDTLQEAGRLNGFSGGLPLPEASPGMPTYRSIQSFNSGGQMQ
jgi:hypothetical protein